MTTTIFQGYEQVTLPHGYKPIQLVEVNMSNGDEQMSLNEALDYAELCKKQQESQKPSNGSGSTEKG